MNKEKTLISPWCNIDGDLMRTTLDNYLLNPVFSDKVLEILRIRSVAFEPRIRIFIGQSIKMSDYPEYNVVQIQSLINLRNNIINSGVPESDVPDFVESVSSICFWEGGPRVTPLVTKEQDSNFYTTLATIIDTFGNSILTKEEIERNNDKKRNKLPLELSFWLHVNSEGKYLLPSLDPKLTPLFRVRSIDIDTWKKATEEYIKTGNCPEYISKDDVKLSEINMF